MDLSNAATSLLYFNMPSYVQGGTYKRPFNSTKLRGESSLIFTQKNKKRSLHAKDVASINLVLMTLVASMYWT